MQGMGAVQRAPVESSTCKVAQLVPIVSLTETAAAGGCDRATVKMKGPALADAMEKCFGAITKVPAVPAAGV